MSVENYDDLERLGMTFFAIAFNRAKKPAKRPAFLFLVR